MPVTSELARRVNLSELARRGGRGRAAQLVLPVVLAISASYQTRVAAFGTIDAAGPTCFNTPGFQGQRGTCKEYRTKKYCNSKTKKAGKGWLSEWGPLDPAATVACCACGGGSVQKPTKRPNSSSSRTKRPPPPITAGCDKATRMARVQRARQGCCSHAGNRCAKSGLPHDMKCTARCAATYVPGVVELGEKCRPGVVSNTTQFATCMANSFTAVKDLYDEVMSKGCTTVGGEYFPPSPGEPGHSINIDVAGKRYMMREIFRVCHEQASAYERPHVPSAVRVTVGRTPLHIVDRREVSFALDIARLKQSRADSARGFDWNNPATRKLFAALSRAAPYVLRISGTADNSFTFGVSTAATEAMLPEAVFHLLDDGASHDIEGDIKPFWALNVTHWDAVLAFAKATRADLVLGLNQLHRTWPNGGVRGCDGADARSCTWIDSNMRTWIEYNKAKRGVKVYGYELGNEPGCYANKLSLDADHMAADFSVLKSTLAEVYNGAAPGTVPRVMGPDSGACSRLTTTDSALLGEIIDRPQPPPLDVVTFHHYAMPKNSFTGQKYNVSDYVANALSPVTDNTMAPYLPLLKKTLPLGTETPLWLGEGASTFSQPKFISSFAFIYGDFNILKQGGLHGVDVYVKQSVASLVRQEKGSWRTPGAWVPTPQYYFALLWKRLMGTAVLAATTAPAGGGVLAAARNRSKGGGFAVALANLGRENTTATVALHHGGCMLFLLEPVGGDASSVDVTLNGKLLTAKDGRLPKLSGRKVKCSAVRLPSLAVAFVTGNYPRPSTAPIPSSS